MDDQKAKTILVDCCSICYSGISESGEHVLSSLNCGHVFGKSCIEKWVIISKKCPQCNQKANKKQIRRLFPSVSLGGSESSGLVDNSADSDDPVDLGTPRELALERENLALKRKLEELEHQLKESSMPEHARDTAGSDYQFERCLAVCPIGEQVFAVSAIRKKGPGGSLCLVALPASSNLSCDAGYAVTNSIHRASLGTLSIRCIAYCGASCLIVSCTSGELLRWRPCSDSVTPLGKIPDSVAWCFAGQIDGNCGLLAGDGRGRIHCIEAAGSQSLSVCRAPIHSLALTSRVEREFVASSVLRTVILTRESTDTKVLDISENIGTGCVGLSAVNRFITASFRGNKETGVVAHVDVFSLADGKVVKMHSLTGHSDYICMMRAVSIQEQGRLRIISPCETNKCVMWTISEGAPPIKRLLETSRNRGSDQRSAQVDLWMEENGCTVLYMDAHMLRAIECSLSTELIPAG